MFDFDHERGGKLRIRLKQTKIKSMILLIMLKMVKNCFFLIFRWWRQHINHGVLFPREIAMTKITNLREKTKRQLGPVHLESVND